MIMRRNYLKNSSLFMLFCAMYALVVAQITVVPGGSPTQIVQQLAGQGVVISNPQINCDPDAFGSFSGGTLIGINSGVILTTGDAEDAEGPNNSGSTSTDNCVSRK